MGVLGGFDLLRPAVLRSDALEAVYAEAWGYDQRVAVEQATLRIGAFEIDAVAVGVERDDVAERHRAGPWRSPYGRTSGLLFAGVIGPLQPGRHPLEVELTLADGRKVVAANDEVIVAARTGNASVVVPDADVAIVMATHNPQEALFERQVASIREQRHGAWSCVVCDDVSSPQQLDAMRATLANDERFVLVENEQRAGFYLNFERALQLVPASVRFVALSDQDDIWYPTKLVRQLAVLDADPATHLVASDVRVVDRSGSVIAPTYYTQRAPTHEDPYSLFIVNSLIGASMVFRRALLDLALPFPRAFPNRYHDHWLARSALFAGTIGFVDATLHDYVQHDSNVIGNWAANAAPSRPVVKSILQRVMGAQSTFPPAWREPFVNFPLEVSIAAQLLAARRRAPAEPPEWLGRVTFSGDGEMRSLARLVVDLARLRSSTNAPRACGVGTVRRTIVELRPSARRPLLVIASNIEPRPTQPTLLAFYLPQFHPIPENDEWWGAGFTEWRNVVRGSNLYPTQHQPNIPGELGFYDLRVPEVREAQAALAAAHGINGFCYYHYWFSGRRILEMPVNEMIRTGSPEFPFCLCWANEPWTRNWDGGSREVLISQRHSVTDDRNHIRWLIRAFRDERYIRVGDRPVLFIYNVGALPAPRRTAEVWREECLKAGVGDPYLVQFVTFGNDSPPHDSGFDAAAEFLPHHVHTNLQASGRDPVHDVRNLNNLIYRYDDLVEGQLALGLPSWPRYQCVVPNWDNTPRKPQGKANLFLGSTPQKYEHWLRRTIERATAARHEFVLINAWNEWAEGAYLEPDLRHGRAYLEATARAAGVDPSRVDLTTIHRGRKPKPHDGASGDEVLQEMYEDLKVSSAREISELLRQIQQLEDAMSTGGHDNGGDSGRDGELAQRVADFERRLVVRASNALSRNLITGRALRTFSILRRDWKDL